MGCDADISTQFIADRARQFIWPIVFCSRTFDQHFSSFRRDTTLRWCARLCDHRELCNICIERAGDGNNRNHIECDAHGWSSICVRVLLRHHPFSLYNICVRPCTANANRSGKRCSLYDMDDSTQSISDFERALAVEHLHPYGFRRYWISLAATHVAWFASLNAVMVLHSAFDFLDRIFNSARSHSWWRTDQRWRKGTGWRFGSRPATRWIKSRCMA